MYRYTFYSSSNTQRCLQLLLLLLYIVWTIAYNETSKIHQSASSFIYKRIAYVLVGRMVCEWVWIIHYPYSSCMYLNAVLASTRTHTFTHIEVLWTQYNHDVHTHTQIPACLHKYTDNHCTVACVCVRVFHQTVCISYRCVFMYILTTVKSNFRWDREKEEEEVKRRKKTTTLDSVNNQKASKLNFVYFIHFDGFLTWNSIWFEMKTQ